MNHFPHPSQKRKLDEYPFGAIIGSVLVWPLHLYLAILRECGATSLIEVAFNVVVRISVGIRNGSVVLWRHSAVFPGIKTHWNKVREATEENRRRLAMTPEDREKYDAAKKRARG